MPQLHVDVRFRYGTSFDLDVRFESSAGVTALVGPSGCGKSTILQLIAGILMPVEGVIRLGDRVLVDTRAGISLRPEDRRIGVVFQDHLLFPHLSVRKNLLFGMGRQGSPPVDLAKVVEILEIGELLERAPSTLSGGQRQRVAVGRAILRGPELLLLDEPLAALDHALKDRVLDYLERVFAEWRMTTLFVSHDMADVERIAESRVLLERGRVVTDPSSAS